MPKHPKVSRHRIPMLGVRPSDPIDERYQAEIDHSISKLTRQYESARKRLEAAEKRAEKLANTRERKRAQDNELTDLMRVIEDRRAELHELERLMMPGDYTATGHRPVPSSKARQVI